MRQNFFSNKLIRWYEVNKRSLPWRETHDPFRIWLSEVILQQTRVAQGLPYYERFVKTFPSVEAVARAPEQKVLRLWQGLGYYSRARHLHRCAKIIVNEFDGKFPPSFELLKKLPGIGDYTAAAIASFAFGEPVAAVDGNVYRVLARVFGNDVDIATHEGKKFFFSLANQLIDKRKPAIFNQALMEFGALQCSPKNPKCEECVFAQSCEANNNNLQQFLPVKSKKMKIKTRYFYYFVIRDKNKIWMKCRTEKDIWHGLYDFYLIEKSRHQKISTMIKNDELLMMTKISAESKTMPHILSHQKLKVKFIEVTLAKPKEKELKLCGLKKFTNKEIFDLPKPILVERFLKTI